MKIFISHIYNETSMEVALARNTINNLGHTPVIFYDKPIRSYLNPVTNSIENYFKNIDMYLCLLNYKTLRTIPDLFNTGIMREIIYLTSTNLPTFFIIIDKEQLIKTSEKISGFIHIAYNEEDIQTSIQNYIQIFNKHSKYRSYFQKTNHFVKSLYYLDPNNFGILFSKYKSYSSLNHYYDIYKKFNIQSISNITTNKCIIDPIGSPISDISSISIEVSEVNDWLLNELNKNPTDLYKLSSRKFEELIAEIFIRKGYNVELTPATRDGGKDIFVAKKNDLGSFLYIVECKKYKPTHKVGVNVLRDLYGVLSKERATYGIAVTTSYFSKPAKDFQQELQFQMSLKDFDSIKQWLHEVT